jgi:hypothetical protein
MLVQSKWDDTVAGDRGLDQQVEEMRRRTKDSYVWSYGPDGVSVFPANQDGLVAARRGTAGGTVGSLLSDGVACRAGDRGIGIDLSKPLVESLNDKLRELAVGKGLSFIVRTR